MANKNDFGTFEAQALLTVACIVMKLCQVNVEETDRFMMAVVCSVQVLWTFCGFNKNNRANTFRIPTIYKKMDDDLPSFIDMWCDAVQVLSQIVRKNEFVARFLLKHKLPHRAQTVPLVSASSKGTCSATKLHSF